MFLRAMRGNHNRQVNEQRKEKGAGKFFQIEIESGTDPHLY